MSPNVLELGSLEPITRQVKIGEVIYTVSEASEPSALSYLNSTANSFRYDDGKIVGYSDDLHGNESRLARDNITPELPEKVVVPYRVIKGIYDLVLEITPSLRKKPAEAKKDNPKGQASSTEGTSSSVENSGKNSTS